MITTLLFFSCNTPQWAAFKESAKGPTIAIPSASAPYQVNQTSPHAVLLTACINVAPIVALTIGPMAPAIIRKRPRPLILLISRLSWRNSCSIHRAATTSARFANVRTTESKGSWRATNSASNRAHPPPISTTPSLTKLCFWRSRNARRIAFEGQIGVVVCVRTKISMQASEAMKIVAIQGNMPTDKDFSNGFALIMSSHLGREAVENMCLYVAAMGAQLGVPAICIAVYRLAAWEGVGFQQLA